jgi:hypothetical protein
MLYIDYFNHFFPKPLWDRMLDAEGAVRDMGKRMRGVPAIYDIDERLKLVNRFAAKNYKQVISLGMPPLESLGEPQVVEEYAKLGNDGMAELVERHSSQFCGFLASLPMNSPNAAREAERAFTSAPTVFRFTPISTARRLTMSASLLSSKRLRDTESQYSCTHRAAPGTSRIIRRRASRATRFGGLSGGHTRHRLLWRGSSFPE